MYFTEIRKRLNERQGQRDYLTKRIAEERERLDKLKSRSMFIREAQTILQSLIQKIQESTFGELTKIVTKSLASVYGSDAYKFRIDFDKKRGKTEAVIKFERNGEEFDPLSESGGGCVELAAFALRVAVVFFERTSSQSVLILDEPFSAVDKYKFDSLKEMLERVCNELGFQVIMTTHIEALTDDPVLNTENL